MTKTGIYDDDILVFFLLIVLFFMLYLCRLVSPIEIQRVVDALIREHPFLQDKKVLTNRKSNKQTDTTVCIFSL